MSVDSKNNLCYHVEKDTLGVNGGKNMKKLILIIVIVLLLCACEKDDSRENEKMLGENETSVTDDPDNNDTVDDEDKIDEIPDVQGESETEAYGFLTEYEIEEYCGELIVVSKNDGLLYGVLDARTGKEIVPIKYDEIDLKSDSLNEYVYIVTWFEGVKSLFDSNGNDLGLRCLEDEYFFIENSYHDNEVYVGLICGLEIFLYDSKGESKLYEFNLADIVGRNISAGNSITCISSDCFLYKMGGIYSGVIDGRGNIIHSFKGTITNAGIISECASGLGYGETGSWLLLVQGDMDYGYYSIDSNGKIAYVADYDVYNQDVYFDGDWVKRSEDGDKYGHNYEYFLEEGAYIYTSNDTWKLVDGNKKAIYDERYYNMERIGDWYFLSNEDDDICVVDRKGTVVIDYESGFTYSKGSVYYDGTELDDWDTFFYDRDTFIIVTKENGMKKVNYFSFQAKN